MGGLFTGPPKLPLRDPSSAPQDAASDGPDWRQPGRQSTVLAMLQPPDAQTPAPLPPPSPPRASLPSAEAEVPQRRAGRQSTVLSLAEPLRILPRAEIDASNLIDEDGGSQSPPPDTRFPDHAPHTGATKSTTIYEAPIPGSTATDARDGYKAGDQLVRRIMEDQDHIRFEAFEGPQAGGREHARQGPGESYHFHLSGPDNERGPRISSETFKPLTPEDEKLFTGKYKAAIDSLSDAQKAYLRSATREVFHTGEVPPRLIQRLGRSGFRGMFPRGFD